MEQRRRYGAAWRFALSLPIGNMSGWSQPSPSASGNRPLAFAVAPVEDLGPIWLPGSGFRNRPSQF